MLIEILIGIGALLILLLGYVLGRALGREEAKREFPDLLKTAREDATKRSRSVLSGQFTEQLAPYLPDFPYSPNEVRFIGKPIDFLVFKGMDEKNIAEVVFVEVKYGSSTLSSQERKLKEAIQNKKVSWKEYRLNK